MRLTIVCLIFGTLTLGMNCAASADGIDLAAFLDRGIGDFTLPGAIAVAVALMIVNYVLNLIVIGLPAVKVGPVKIRRVAIELVGLTLLGQLADRIGEVIADILVIPVVAMLGSGYESLWLGLALDWLVSGIAIAALAMYFLRRRWETPPRAAWLIACAAAVFTNPAWAIAIATAGRLF